MVTIWERGEYQMNNNNENLNKLTSWFTGVVSGFLLRGSLFRGDDFAGYLPGFMLLAASVIFLLLPKPPVKK
jgi:hypothetical protein